MSEEKLAGPLREVAALYRSLPSLRRRQLVQVALLMVAGGFAELIAIGAVLPFLTILADEGSARSAPLLGSLIAPFDGWPSDQRLLAFTGLFVAATLFAAALRLVLARASQTLVFRIGHDLACDIQRRILAQPFAFHVMHNSSEVIASLEKVQMLVFNVLLQLMQSVIALFIAACILALLVAIDPVTAMTAAVAFGAMYLVVTRLFRRRLQHNSDVIGRAFNERVRLVQESLGGIRDILIDHSQPVYLEAFRKADHELVSSKANTAFMGAAPRFIIEAAGMILIALLAAVLAGQPGGIGRALPVLGALALGAQRLLPLLQQAYYGWSALAGNRSLLDDTLRLLRLPLPADSTPAQPLELKRDIRLDRVGFSYPAHRDPALRDISLTIPRGARVAFVGRTGSGKSTLADLIMGLLDPSEGEILIDGETLDASRRSAWQRNIAHVPQAIFLSDSSIARNIALGLPDDHIDMDRVERAAAMAQLDTFIASLPDTFDTSVGERGVRLSGGQRQRLGLARAFYKDAQILVLDEATSALDDDTERDVMRALDLAAADGRTVIMIAHRLSTVQGCDLVVRLDHGKIAALGSHDDVLGRSAAHRE